jgi:hypothetical protein
MKKIIALSLAAGLGLAGCNSVVAPTDTTTTVINVAKQVEDAAVAACGFLPAATTIATIISASPSVLTATQIAQLICSAVTKKSAVRGSHPTVNVGGKAVVVEGKFVK